MPIRVRLAALFTLAAVVLVVLGTVVFVHQLRQGLNASLDTDLQARADTLIHALPADLSTGLDFQEATTAHGVITGEEAVAQLLAPDGQVRDSTETAGPRPLLHGAAYRHALQGPTLLDVDLGHGYDPQRLLARPLHRPDGTWVAVVGTSLETADAAISRVQRNALIAGGVLVILSGLGSWFLATAALRPVERMRRQAADLSEHDPIATLNVPATRDEIAALGRTMNDLLARLHQALERQRAFVADASHELRTPLAILLAELELAGRPGRSRDDLADAVTNAADETSRLARLTDDLLLLARSDHQHLPVQTERQPIAPILAASIDAASVRAAQHDVTLELDAENHLVAAVAAQQLRRAVDNLIDNALAYAPPGSTITTTARHDNSGIVIEVADHGSGFPENFLPHAFERFRRADTARARDNGGTGLGLAIVRAIAEAHGGTAEAANQPEGGARVRVRLPSTM